MVGFVKLVQTLRNYLALLILVRTRKLDFAEVSPMEFVNIKMHNVVTLESVKKLIETMIYCRGSTYAELYGKNCLIKQSQRRKKLKLWNKLCE